MASDSGNYSSSFIDEGPVYGAHDLSVSETSLVFELQLDGDRTSPQTVDVKNNGTKRVVIYAVAVSSGSEDFTLVNENDYPDYLDPDEEFNIVIDFTARVDGVAAGVVQIFTNETDRLPYTIQLSSRTQRVPQFDDLYGNLDSRLILEISQRINADNVLKALLRAEATSAMAAEVVARNLADTTAKNTLRGEFNSAISAEASARTAAINAAISGIDGDITTVTAAINNEITARAAADNTVKSTLRGEIASAIAAEAALRASGDSLVSIGVGSLDTTLRAHIAASVATEAGLRSTADGVLSGRLTLVEQAQSDDTVFGIDLEARNSIALEITNRITAISAEASLRLALESSLTTAMTNSNAAFATQISTLATTQGAQASAITTIQANYQTAGQVNTIAAALVATETSARVSAIAAEATARTTLAATLRTERATAIGVETTNRTAAITDESNLRIAGDATLASNIVSLMSSTSNARGLTLNGTFSAGTTGWISSLTFVNAGGRITPTSSPGQYQQLYSTPAIDIDVNRAYQVTCSFRVFVAPCVVLVGVKCYNSDGNLLGTIHDDEAGGDLITGSKTVNNVMTGSETYPIPTTRIGTKFPTGTVKIEVALWANFPSPSAVPNSYVEVYGLWVEDFTAAAILDARVTEEITTVTTATEAVATQVESLQADFVAATGDISGLTDTVNNHTAAIITANARIDTEQVARATAVGAEATRVNNLLTSYTTTSGMNSAISTAVSAEATDRTTAISTAMGAEVTRVNNLLATYTTTTGMNSAISTAVSAEATNRTIAISTAMGAEVTRVNNLLASYTTTTGMNSAITTAISAEVTNRNTAIATSVSAEATRTDNLLTSYTKTGPMNTAISAAVSTEASARSSADSALASDITTVSTNVGGLSATVTSHTSSINGVLAKAGIVLNVNGYITGWSLNNNGSSGSFAVQASTFSVSDGSNPGVVPFEIVGGVTYIKSAVIQNATITNAKIANLTIETNKIADLSITRSASIFFNFAGYSYPTKLVWWSLPAQNIYVFVGDNQGDYTFVYDPFGESYYWSYTPGTGDHDLITSYFQTSVRTADNTNQTQMVHLEAMITVERDGSSDDYMALRVIRTNDNVLMPEIYNNIRVRAGRQPVSFFFKDGDPLPNVDNTYTLQFYYNTDTARFYEATLRATLYRK